MQADSAYRVLAEQALELVARHVPDSTVRYASQGSRLLGQQPEELVGLRFVELLHPEDRGHAEAALTALLRGQQARASFSARFRRSDQSYVWLDVSAYPVRHPNTQVVEQYVTVSREALFDNGRIHELRELQRRVSHLTTLLDSVPGMIYQWTLRPDGSREFTFCNKWPESALGIDPTQLGTLDLRLAERTHPEDSREAWRRWDRARDALEPWSWYGRFYTRAGKVLNVVGHATPAKQADGSVLWSGVLLDDPQRSTVNELEPAPFPAHFEPMQAPSSLPAKPPDPKTPLAGLTLLVVEDNEINQVLARDLLEASGASVVLASDGETALRLTNQRAFDAILMDVQMPGMDGHATTRRMRERDNTAHTPIIAMTAHAFDAERNKCLASGMNAHVSKPIHPRQLIATLLQWTRPSQAPERAPSSQPAAGPSGLGSNPPSFDGTALDTVFRDPKRQVGFLRKFVDSARAALDELGRSLEVHDHQQIGFLGHKLKSSAKACGAHALSSAFAELEQQAKAVNWSEIEQLHVRAEGLLCEVRAHVEQRERALKA